MKEKKQRSVLGFSITSCIFDEFVSKSKIIIVVSYLDSIYNLNFKKGFVLIKIIN